jgi:anthranilate phosphoribosyltransferase
MAPVMAGVFASRGDSVLVMRGEDGLDEFSTAAPTRLWLARAGRVTEEVVDAADLGIPRSRPGDLRGGTAEFNADVAHRLLAGQSGPVRDAVLVNAAAALAAHAGRAGDLRPALREGIERAAQSIDSGSAAAILGRWIEAARAARAAE